MRRVRAHRLLVFLLVLMAGNLAGASSAFAQMTAAVSLTKQAMAAIAPLMRRAGAVGEHDIAAMAERSALPGGSKLVGRALSERQLSREALEDTYLRILVHQGRMGRAEAESMFLRLSGTPGFQETLRKASSANSAVTIGHLNELRIALGARQQGLQVTAIGRRFDDGIKKGTTDLDLLIRRGSQQLVVEAKDYPADGSIQLDQFRADMLTLNAFVSANPQERIVPVFTITNVPSNQDVWRQLQLAARQQSVELITGDPVEQAIQMRQLLEVVQ